MTSRLRIALATTVAVSVLVLIAPACSKKKTTEVSSDQTTSTTTTTLAANSLAFEVVETGGGSYPDGATRQAYRVKDIIDWEQGAWQGRSPVPSMPTIDPATQTIIAVFGEPELTGGYTLAITDVTLDDDTMVVHATQTAPGNSCIVTAALDQPYAVVVVEHDGYYAELDLTEEAGTSC